MCGHTSVLEGTAKRGIQSPDIMANIKHVRANPQNEYLHQIMGVYKQ